MPTYEIKPEDLPASIENDSLAAFESVVGTIRTECKVRAPAIIQRLISSEVPMPVDRGTYRRDFHVDDIPGGAEIYNSAPHGPIVELGRRAGSRMPPVDLIEAWVQRKRIADGPKARSVAYMIARSIARRGLKGHHILARMEAELTPDVDAAVSRALGRAG